MIAEASRDDHLLASELAQSAGRLLVDLRSSLVADGASAEELKNQGDASAHHHLIDALARTRPDDIVLSEESAHLETSADRRIRRDGQRVWIVDPLDGTREFSEPPRDDWAVHVALCVDGVLQCGAVALPAQQQIFSTADPPSIPKPGDPRRIAVSRTRPPLEASTIRDRLGGVLVPMGSAGAKAMAILAGTVDVYPHSGGQFEWDSAAPVAVARAAGLWCSRIDGSDLRYNRDDSYLPDLLICRTADAPSILECLASENGS